MPKTILVTGGAGFIGSHLCETLVSANENVICVDNLITGSQKNIAHLLTKNNFKFINHDVTTPIKQRLGKIDQIYHLASPADPNIHSPFSYLSHPFETMAVNTIGTSNMCELALKDHAKISFASTSEVYGDPEISPQSEEYRGNVSTTGPRAVYDEAKRFGETIVSSYVREKKLDGRITRIFNTYGPRMNLEEGRSVVNFIKQSLSKEPISIYGDGKQTRAYCYINDQVEGQIKAMENLSPGDVVNIGNPQPITILEFATLIKKLTKSKSPIVFSEPLPADDPKSRNPDISKAKKLMDWEPKTTLEEGLASTIKYFQSML